MNNKKYRNKKAIIIIFLFLISSVLIMRSILNNYDTNSCLTFTKDDVTKIWVFDDNNHGLSYDYEISNSDAMKISNELVKSKRNIAKESDRRMIANSPFFIIMLNGVEEGGSISSDRTITIYPKDDKSVYVVLSKIGGIYKFVVIRSTEIASYLKKVNNQFE
jgi:hypothetical protein